MADSYVNTHYYHLIYPNYPLVLTGRPVILCLDCDISTIQFVSRFYTSIYISGSQGYINIGLLHKTRQQNQYEKQDKSYTRTNPIHQARSLSVLSRAWLNTRISRRIVIGHNKPRAASKIAVRPCLIPQLSIPRTICVARSKLTTGVEEHRAGDDGLNWKISRALR